MSVHFEMQYGTMMKHGRNMFIFEICHEIE